MTNWAEFRSQLASSAGAPGTSGGMEFSAVNYEIKKSLTPALAAIKRNGGSVLGMKTLDDGKLVTVQDRDGKTYNLFVRNELTRPKATLAALAKTLASKGNAPLSAEYIPVALPKAIETPIATKPSDAPEEPAGNPDAPTLPKRKPSGALINTPRSDAGMEAPSDSLNLNLPDYSAGLDTTGIKPSPKDAALLPEPTSAYDTTMDMLTTVAMHGMGGMAAGWGLRKIGAKTIGTAVTTHSKALLSLEGRLFTTLNPVFNIVKHIAFRPLQMAWYGTKALAHKISFLAPKSNFAKLRNLAKLKLAKDTFLLKSFRASVKTHGLLSTIKGGIVSGASSLWIETKAIAAPVGQLAKSSWKYLAESGGSRFIAKYGAKIGLKFAAREVVVTQIAAVPAATGIGIPVAAAWQTVATAGNVLWTAWDVFSIWSDYNKTDAPTQPSTDQ